jgi:hypothetical protein
MTAFPHVPLIIVPFAQLRQNNQIISKGSFCKLYKAGLIGTICKYLVMSPMVQVPLACFEGDVTQLVAGEEGRKVAAKGRSETGHDA